MVGNPTHESPNPNSTTAENQEREPELFVRQKLAYWLLEGSHEPPSGRKGAVEGLAKA